jgi:hypothetical protein
MLAMMRDNVCKISKWGLPPVYSNPASVYGAAGGKYLYTNNGVICIAVLAMYEGYEDFGLDLLRKDLEMGYCHWGYMWDGVNFCSGYGDTGEIIGGWDYWFNWSIWAAAAALANGDFSVLLKPGGLVNRMIKAAAPGPKSLRPFQEKI